MAVAATEAPFRDLNPVLYHIATDFRVQRIKKRRAFTEIGRSNLGESDWVDTTSTRLRIFTQKNSRRRAIVGSA